MELHAFHDELEKLSSHLVEDVEAIRLDLTDDELTNFITFLTCYQEEEKLSNVILHHFKHNIYSLSCLISAPIWNKVKDGLYLPAPLLKIKGTPSEHKNIQDKLKLLCQINSWLLPEVSYAQMEDGNITVTGTSLLHLPSNNRVIEVHYRFASITSRHFQQLVKDLDTITPMEHMVTTKQVAGAHILANIYTSNISFIKGETDCLLVSNTFDRDQLLTMLGQMPLYTEIRTDNKNLTYELISNANGCVSLVQEDRIWYSLPPDIVIYNDQIWGSLNISTVTAKFAFVRSFRRCHFSKPYEWCGETGYVPLRMYEEWSIFQKHYYDELWKITEDINYLHTDSIVLARKIYLQYPDVDILIGYGHYLIMRVGDINVDNIHTSDRSDLIEALKLVDDYDVISNDTVSNADVKDIALGVNIGGHFYRTEDALRLFKDPLTRKNIPREVYLQADVVPYNHLGAGIVWRDAVTLQIPIEISVDEYCDNPNRLKVEISMLKKYFTLFIPENLYQGGIFKHLLTKGYVLPESTAIFIQRNGYCCNTKISPEFRNILKQQSYLEHFKWLVG